MDYRVRIDPRARQLELLLDLTRSSVSASERARADWALAVPTWVPGAYAFLKYGRDVFDVRAECKKTGEKLTVRRSGMSGLVVEGARHEIAVRARITAADESWGELVGFVGHDLAIVRAAHFVFDPAHAGPCSLTIDVPGGWAMHDPAGAKRVELGSAGSSPREGDPAGGAARPSARFEFPNFAALLDAPVVLGRFNRTSEVLDGVTFHHVFVDKAVGFDREAPHLVREVMAVAAAARDVFGRFPFEEYSFIYSTDPRATWGLEHPNATLMGLGETVFIDPEQRRAAVRLAAHELFHAWNVCRLKPKAFLQPDLVHGSFPDGLWLSEGFTRYYELLLATRVGSLTPARFLSNLVRYDDALRLLPASHHVDLVDSSRATFLNHNRYPGASSATIDYYDKGMLVAFALDACLRTAERPSSLDAAMAAFYTEFEARGFDTEDAIAFFEGFARPLGPKEPVGAMLERIVRTPAMPDTLGWLAALGVATERGAVPALGAWLLRNAGPLVVDVAEGSAAARAGLGAGEEIVATDGFSYRIDALQWLVRHQPSFTLTVKAGSVLRDVAVSPSSRECVLSASLPGGGAALAGWLGPNAAALVPGSLVPLVHYDNFHARESML